MVSKNPISCFHFDDYQLDALHRGLPQNDPLKRDEEKKKKNFLSPVFPGPSRL